MIINLYENPSLITRVAQWQFAEWGWMYPGQTLQDRMNELQRHLLTDPLPTTFVAIRDDFPVGSVSLIACDMPEHAALCPWLASLYVEPGSRGKGVGTELVKHVEKAAYDFGYDSVFLYTGNALEYFLDREWEPIHTMHRSHGQVVIMERDVTFHEKDEAVSNELTDALDTETKIEDPNS